MTNRGTIPLLVCWHKHRRQIYIQPSDTLSTIEQAINNVFGLNSSNALHNEQIQFFDNEFKKFIDLCDATMDSFQRLIQKLSTMLAPPKSTKEWRLKIVRKMVHITGKSKRLELDQLLFVFFLKIAHH